MVLNRQSLVVVALIVCTLASCAAAHSYDIVVVEEEALASWEPAHGDSTALRVADQTIRVRFSGEATITENAKGEELYCLLPDAVQDTPTDAELEEKHLGEIHTKIVEELGSRCFIGDFKGADAKLCINDGFNVGPKLASVGRYGEFRSAAECPECSVSYSPGTKTWRSIYPGTRKCDNSVLPKNYTTSIGFRCAPEENSARETFLWSVQIDASDCVAYVELALSSVCAWDDVKHAAALVPIVCHKM